ncbi:MAG: NAD-dependent epimerase/dehydratase family protein [Planctomycetota bacterium]
MSNAAIITGGAGFIGSHLAERLCAAGRRVLLVDDLSTGRRQNVEHLLGDGVEIVHGRAAEVLQDPSVFKGVTEVYHLAAAVGVKLIVDDPAGMIATNIDDTIVVLRACAAADVPVLVASSSEVYGKCPVLPLREDMDLVFGPTTASRWSYGLTKALDEHLAIDLARRDGLKSVVVRLFNTIGPRQVGRYGMVAPRFVSRACAGQPLEVYGDGGQTRAFCDARDVVAAMTGLMAAPDGAAFGGVFNVGNDEQVTIRGLAELVIERAAAAGRSGSVIQTVPYEAVYGEGFEDPPHRLPDVSRLRDAINWSPTFTLEQTIDALIADECSGVPFRGSSLTDPAAAPTD